MSNTPEPESNSKPRIADIAAVVLFVLGIIGWLAALDSIALVFREWAIYPDAGDAAIGLIIFGPIVLLVSFVLLLASIGAICHAKRLPRWFRVTAVVSPALGCLVGLAIIHRALGG